MANDAQRAWVRTVLGLALADSASGEPMQAKTSTVDYIKLLLRWRDAQARATENLRTLAQGVLALPDVQRDPRIAQVHDVAKTLPNLVPKFGEDLADQLDGLMNGGAKAEGMREAALGTLARYRALLNGQPALPKLEDFARRRLGADLATVTELANAIRDLEASLKAA